MVIGIDPYVIAKDAVKVIREKLKDDPELREKIMDVNEALLDLHEQNIILRQELEAFRTKKNDEDRLEWDERNGVFWVLEDGKRTGQTACPICWAEEQRITYLQRWREGWLCRIHDKYISPPPQPTQSEY